MGELLRIGYEVHNTEERQRWSPVLLRSHSKSVTNRITKDHQRVIKEGCIYVYSVVIFWVLPRSRLEVLRKTHVETEESVRDGVCKLDETWRGCWGGIRETGSDPIWCSETNLRGRYTTPDLWRRFVILTRILSKTNTRKKVNSVKIWWITSYRPTPKIYEKDQTINKFYPSIYIKKVVLVFIFKSNIITKMTKQVHLRLVTEIIRSQRCVHFILIELVIKSWGKYVWLDEVLRKQ